MTNLNFVRNTYHRFGSLVFKKKTSNMFFKTYKCKHQNINFYFSGDNKKQEANQKNFRDVRSFWMGNPNRCDFTLCDNFTCS